MKKVLVAAAGLMLVGTMASSAMAEFEFSGDARARFYAQKNYDEFSAISGVNTKNDTRWKSRVRLNVKATTKGGAYAITRFHAGDGTWNGGNSGTTDVNVDRAYIGVPFGPVVVEAGRQGRDITPWLLYGNDVDGIDLNWGNDSTAVVAFYDMNNENTATTTSDNDNQTLGIVVTQKFGNGWDLLVGAAEQINDVKNATPGAEPTDKNAFIGTVQVNGAVGDVALTAELATQGKHFYSSSANYNADDDTGFGGYVQASMPVGAVDLGGMLGFTADGYMMDGGEFGPFNMLNSVNVINTGIQFAALGETFFAVFNPSYQVSESLTLEGVLAWANVDDASTTSYGDGSKNRDMIEVSGVVKYAVTDGAALKTYLGYLDTDNMTDDNPYAFGMSLEVTF